MKKPRLHRRRARERSLSSMRRRVWIFRICISGATWLLFTRYDHVASFHVSPLVRIRSQIAAQGNSYWEVEQDTQDQLSPLYRPIPSMPSPLFVSLAQSQLELLAHSLTMHDPADKTAASKIKSMALYLPQENSQTGQLEFLPAVLYPNPLDERVFIASDAQSGVAPSLPKTLTKLPGFTHAASLLPGYPMVSSSGDSDTAAIGEVEEVLCDRRTRKSALSVPLFSGSQTVGVLLVWPTVEIRGEEWTDRDKDQVSRAAESLSMTLSMDTERTVLQAQSERFRQSLSDSLHQVKNPIQALRTYGKLLQRQIAQTEDDDQLQVGGTPQLLALARHLMVQSDRVADLLTPMDALISTNANYLMPSPDPEPSALARYELIYNITGVEPTRKSENKAKSDTKAGARQRPVELGRPEKRPVRRVSDAQEETPSDTRSKRVPSVVGDLDLQMSFVSDVLEPILSPFRAIAADYGIDFHVETSADELPGVTICSKSLQEAVSNLIDNALKYVVLSKPDSAKRYHPRVRVRFERNLDPEPPGVSIVVEDNGPGIPQGEDEAIFERGFRSAQTSSSVDGSGIGLDISRSLVESMGGRLSSVRPEHGSVYDGAVMKVVLYRKPTMR